jgi:hypothetical protein
MASEVLMNVSRMKQPAALPPMAVSLVTLILAAPDA